MVRQNEKIKKGKLGLNYVMNVVDNCGCNFNPISQENDIGIDAQIEFFENDGVPTGDIVYIQIKTGESYYSELTRKCTIPVGTHRDYWLKLKNPVIGIVCIINKESGFVDNAYWVNIKDALVSDRNKSNIVFDMEKNCEFNSETFNKFFLPLNMRRLPDISFSEARSLVDYGGGDGALGLVVLCIKYADYEESWKILFEKYEKNIEQIDLYFFVDAISHAFYHPDHFIKSGIYELSDETKKYVKDKIRKFGIQDIISMLELIGDRGIDRGNVGQTIEIIVANIDKGFEKLTKIIQSEDTEYYVEQYAELFLAYQYPDYYKENIYKIKDGTTEFSEKYISDIEQYGGVFLY